MKHLNKYVQSSPFILTGLFIGLFLGWLIFHSNENKTVMHEHSAVKTIQTVWTCSMHPQIRKTAPGLCPICGMDLIPLVQKSTPVDSNAISFTKEAAALANVLTTKVSRQNPIQEIRLSGKIQMDERLLQTQTSHIAGRIEKLMINFTGETIRKGQTLALIYSPELVTAQQELLEAAKDKDSHSDIYEASKERLRLWKLSEKQINAIELSGKVKNTVEIVSNFSGFVTTRRVNNGDYVEAGTALLEVADLSRLWVMFDAYESDLPFLHIGNTISFSLQAMPGEQFSGKIGYIDPIMDPISRVSKVRVEVNNPSGKFKPGMFTTGIITSKSTRYRNPLVIPVAAVLWTGKRSVVYVRIPDSEEPIFKLRKVELGPKFGENFVVLGGLSEGEEVVTQGAFSVDAASQLEGKPSMMD